MNSELRFESPDELLARLRREMLATRIKNLQKLLGGVAINKHEHDALRQCLETELMTFIGQHARMSPELDTEEF